ncbi:MAG: DUF3293 domain-containing protein [Sphingomonas sp.]
MARGVVMPPVQPTASALSAALIAGYRATRYLVQTEPPLALRIDQPDAGLAALLQSHAVSEAAIVCAANPRSEQLPDSENAARHRALEAAIARLGLGAIATRHVADAGNWPDEPGLLVLGASAPTGAELGQRFGQNAIVTIAADGTPRLRLLR